MGGKGRGWGATAYKPIEPVVESLIEAGLATAVAALTPVVTVKR
jgi:release factor H-coupled RctB family protein